MMKKEQIIEMKKEQIREITPTRISVLEGGTNRTNKHGTQNSAF